MREDAWQEATARNDQQPAPTFAPNPSPLTLTQPSPPPMPQPSTEFGSDYLPKPISSGSPGPGDVGAFVGHVDGGPDVYVIPAGSGR